MVEVRAGDGMEEWGPGLRLSVLVPRVVDVPVVVSRVPTLVGVLGGGSRKGPSVPERSPLSFSVFPTLALGPRKGRRVLV